MQKHENIYPEAARDKFLGSFLIEKGTNQFEYFFSKMVKLEHFSQKRSNMSDFE